jgi:tetratricopeptide (TPR) repeat protein
MRFRLSKTPRSLPAAIGLTLILSACSGDEPPESAAAPEPAPPPTIESLDVEFYSDSPGAPVEAPAAEEEPAPAEPAAEEPIAEEPAPPAAPAQPGLDDLRAAVERNSEDVTTRRALGHALRAAGQHQEAVEHFEKALDLDPGPRSLFEVGVAYVGASRLDDAERAYLRVLAAMPNDPRTLHNLGNVASRRGDTNRAIDYYRAAIEADDHYILAYYQLANLLNAAGNQNAAYGAYLSVLERQPRNANEGRAYNAAVLELAALSMAAGDAAQAESLLSQLVARYPEHPQGHYALAQALLTLGRDEEAQRELEIHMRLAEKQPKTAAAAMGQ